MILEYGACAPGDLARQTRIASPNIAVVTTIGPAHLEQLESPEGVMREKGELVRAVSAQGLVILGEEHDYVGEIEMMSQAPVIKVPGRGIELSRNITREICRHLRIPERIMDAALQDFKRPQGRLNIFTFPSMILIDDSYNANPLSVKLGLDTLADVAGHARRRIAILGVMAELGKQGPSLHEQVGNYARASADIVVGVGDLAQHYHPDYWFDSSADCANRIQTLIQPNDCVLVKGSHSVNMPVVVEALRSLSEATRSLQPR
jgi:UDP-N-acetylmuramoyl-tripeptide--D-alanyl-D-alanine ligase